MAEISAKLIKELRDLTGVGMGACKEALVEANGDMDQAVTYLRKKGMATAVKKEGRATNEGLIGSAESDDCVALVEINAETDFVIKNDKFQQFVADIANEAAQTKPASLEALLQQKFSKDKGLTVEEYRTILVQTIGENIQIRRLALLPKNSNKSVGVYTHMGGKIVVAVEMKGQGEENLAKDIAMHIAAASPDFLSPETVPSNVLQNEREIYKSQIQGKPDNIADKIVDGKMSSFYQDRCLTKQLYVKNDKMTVNDVVAERAKQTNKELAISGFTRWSVGSE